MRLSTPLIFLVISSLNLLIARCTFFQNKRKNWHCSIQPMIFRAVHLQAMAATMESSWIRQCSIATFSIRAFRLELANRKQNIHPTMRFGSCQTRLRFRYHERLDQGLHSLVNVFQARPECAYIIERTDSEQLMQLYGHLASQLKQARRETGTWIFTQRWYWFVINYK